MNWYEKLLLVLAMVLFMQVLARTTHRYVMHGWGLGWHRSHHKPHEGAFEREDLYAVTFAFAVALFAVGTVVESIWWIALGITACGAIHAFVRDRLAHQPFGARWLPRRGYLKRLHQARRIHHAAKGKDGGAGFGFLLAPESVRPLAERNRP